MNVSGNNGFYQNTRNMFNMAHSANKAQSQMGRLAKTNDTSNVIDVNELPDSDSNIPDEKKTTIAKGDEFIRSEHGDQSRWAEKPKVTGEIDSEVWVQVYKISEFMNGDKYLYDKELAKKEDMENASASSYKQYLYKTTKLSTDVNHSLTIESMYEFAMDEYNRIEESSATLEAKETMYSELEEVLNNAVDQLHFRNMAKNLQVSSNASHFETDMNIQEASNRFRMRQYYGIENSLQKLTNNLFEFLRNNKGSTDFESALNYINKDSSNNRDINNLSLHEINGFYEYEEKAGYVQTNSVEDITHYSGYFNTAADSTDVKNSSAMDKWFGSLIDDWGDSVFENGQGVKINVYA